MVRPEAEQAVQDALSAGRAILKFISRNNVGDTGSHECGFYLPKHSWQLFTANPPEKGRNAEAQVHVIWGNGLETDSCVKWYGTGTRSEYRLTRFGRDFPYLDRENVGSLLVLIPVSYEVFHAYVLDFDEDIEAVQTALGVEAIGGSVAVFERGLLPRSETEDECIERNLRAFAEAATQFPAPRDFSKAARSALAGCIADLQSLSLDRRILAAVQTEYRLFRLVERKICGPMVTRVFPDIDAFIGTAQTILQRRKSRAGLAFQNQVQNLFEVERIPHEAQPRIEGLPDFVFPSARAYCDPTFPADRLVTLALKTTCKDRWRQVLEEAPRVRQKHLLTLQGGISVNQLRLMREAGVTLVVPKPLQKDYNVEDSGVEILTLDEFALKVRVAS
jgi:type II restriction enzyme